MHGRRIPSANLRRFASALSYHDTDPELHALWLKWPPTGDCEGDLDMPAQPQSTPVSSATTQSAAASALGRVVKASSASPRAGRATARHSVLPAPSRREDPERRPPAARGGRRVAAARVAADWKGLSQGTRHQPTPYRLSDTSRRPLEPQQAGQRRAPAHASKRVCRCRLLALYSATAAAAVPPLTLIEDSATALTPPRSSG